MTKDTSDNNKESTPVIEGAGITHSKKEFKSTGSHSNRSKLILISLVVLLLIGLPLIAYLESKPKCSDELLQRSGSSITGNRPAQLKDISEEIKAKRGYQKDVNCMYVITQYNLDLGDAEEASKTYATILDLYKKEEGFSTALGKETDSLEDIKKKLDILEKFKKNVESNLTGIKER